MANRLKRTLGLFDAFAIGIGAIIGSGIFVVTGIAAGLAGPALLISLVIGAFISGFTALSFAELAHSIPKEGGGYEFARELISPFAGFISGWLWILSNVVTGVVVSLGFASYLALFLPFPVNVNLVAALACLVVTFINYLGARDSSLVNDILVVIKLLILALFVAFGLGFVKSGNFSPFMPTGEIGIMQGATLIFFAYSGFARVTLISEEVKEPKKNIPRAIILALVVSTIVYMLVSFTAIGLVGYKELASSGSPLADAARSVSANLTYFVSIGALVATFSVLLTTLLGLSRISFAMSSESDLPRFFSRLDERSTPYYTVLVFGFTMAILATVSNLLQAVALANFGSLLYYLLTNYAALKLEKRVYPRIIPILGIITCMVLLVFLTWDAWIRGCIVLLGGAVYYYLMKKWQKNRVNAAGARQGS
ncbi:MAG: APC family permease [Candidatus Methanoperedens sp.]|nr:APC family permease [Candidatus Methanoperedens sp.]